MTMKSQLTETPKKRLVAVAWPPRHRVEEAGEVEAHLQPDQLAGELDRAKTMRTAKPSEMPISSCCSDRQEAGRRVERDHRHRRQRRLRAERDQEGERDAHPHRHAALREHRQRAEQREHAQKRPQQRRDPGQDLGLGEGQHRACAGAAMAGASRRRSGSTAACAAGTRPARSASTGRRSRAPRPRRRSSARTTASLVDLRRRLEHADDQADGQHREQHRCRDHQQHVQALLAEREDLL